MTIITTLILAASLSGAAPGAAPAASIPHAEARLNRMVATEAPALHRRATSRALVAGTERLGANIARELSDTRVAPAEARLNRMVETAASTLHRSAMNRALATGTERLGANIARELDGSRTAPAAPAVARMAAPAKNAANPAHGLSASTGGPPAPVLESRQSAPLRTADPSSSNATSGAPAAGMQATPGASRLPLSIPVLGGLLTGFLALAGAAAAAFSRWTS